MRIFHFLLFLNFIWLLSCEQNPLKKISPHIVEGTLQTGERHFSLFEDSLRASLVKVNIAGQSDLIMEWTEGTFKLYRFRIRHLYNLKSRYEFQLKEEDLFRRLPGAQWKFNSKKGTGILEWRPAKDFTGEKPYVKFSLPLFLEFKDSRSLEPAFVVRKNIKVIVYKSLDKPEIYRISTRHNNYKKLDDGNFYTDHGAQLLNLNYYNKLYLGHKKGKRQEIFDHLRFYSETAYIKYSSYDDFGDEMRFDVYSSRGQAIPYKILGFLKQPIYYEKEIRLEDEGKASNPTAVLNKDEAWRLAELSLKKPIPFDQDIYIKHYQIPKKIDWEKLFYKIESPLLCKIYHIISLEFKIKKTGYKGRDLCYLSAFAIFDIPNRNRAEIEEREDIYLLDENNTLKLADKSNWPFYFYKIPDSIKWLMAGYAPIPHSFIGIKLSRADDVSIYIKDYNQWGSSPHIAPYQEENNLLFWSVPEMSGEWHLKSAERIDANDWRLNYVIKPRDSANKNANLFRQAYLKLQPVSKTLAGNPVSFQLSALPSVLAKYKEDFDPKRDIKISKGISYGEGLPEWSSTSVSLSNKIKISYVFPSDFVPLIHKAIPYNNIPTYKIFSKDKVLGYLNLTRPEPLSHQTRSSGTSSEEKKPSLFFENDSDCSKWAEDKKEDGIYIESLCSYRAKLNLRSDSKRLRNKRGELISAYWSYDYSFSEEAVLLSHKFYPHSWSADWLMALKREPFAPSFDWAGPLSKEVKSRIYIFFNVQPVLKCVSLSGASDKKCFINYFLDERVDKEEWENLNKEIASAIQAHVSCSGDRQGSRPDLCSCGANPVFSEEGISVECSTQNNHKGAFSIYLESSSPYIYFLNTEPNPQQGPASYKKTPVKVLSVH